VTVDALATVELLLRCSGADLVPALLSNATLQELVVSVLLRNPYPRVRAQMRQLVLLDAAPLLGRSVLGWCLGVLEQLEPQCGTCDEFFAALLALSRRLPMPAAEDPAQDVGEEALQGAALRTSLARLVSRRLMGFPRSGEGAESRQMVLLGLLRLMQELVSRDVDGRVFQGMELEHLVDRAFEDLLFSVPTLGNKGHRPICPLNDAKSRQLVFLTLLELAGRRHSELSYLVKKVDEFARKGAADLRHRWSYECSYDAKSTPGQYVGLRNQGCTCYMNSLLQNLFMVPALRDAVVSARAKHRKVVPGSQVSDEDLVGQRILVRFGGGLRLEATVLHFDNRLGVHTIKYDGQGADTEVSLVLREGRQGRETGQFDVLPAPRRCTPQVAQERVQTQRVLEQVQRTFCYLQASEKRYFDPRQLVEACKCLNLQYSVYQQNDASEFCDQLLDKLEASLKGTSQLRDLHTIFGGKVVYQKIPQGCEHRDEKEEPFIHLELIIRGKDSIQESLASFVEGEMMDGENQVECEGCGTKKPTIRRVCLSQLPNVLILHLKRFDLDYSTFETVKLNNRCAFPMRLNVKPYTREGVEEAARAAEEAAGQVGGASPAMDTSGEAGEAANGPQPMVMDDGDYDYELKGVVIHAGVAQGGHYYSYIKDRSKGGEQAAWYKFDDEDVTAFDPANIEAQCFGGTTTKGWQGMPNTIETERTSNALMLFYEKVSGCTHASLPHPIR
jgi:ubiquitin carboxyl-terminal hydrolase 9/24